MPKVLMTKRQGIYWPGADRDVSQEEAKSLIASGAAVAFSEANRKKIRDHIEENPEEAESVTFPVEHEPKFRDVKAFVNPPVDNAGAEDDAPTTGKSQAKHGHDAVEAAAAKTKDGPTKR